MLSVPVAVVDALNSLMEAAQASIFRSVEEGSPYLTRAGTDVRGPIHEIFENGFRRYGELFSLVESLGGTPLPLAPPAGDQYLAYLSLKFLLPKLVEAKEIVIRRYENTLKAVGRSMPPAALELIKRHIAEHSAELETLRKAAEAVAAAK